LLHLSYPTYYLKNLQEKKDGQKISGLESQGKSGKKYFSSSEKVRKEKKLGRCGTENKKNEYHNHD
jgi:hypothetical protein